MEHIIGIYKIENLISGQIYIGQSVNIYKRFKEHLRGGLYNDSQLIDEAIQKIGIKNFSFKIIERCQIKELNRKEKFFIQYYNSLIPNGYNKTTGGLSNYEMFLHYTPEILKEIINDLKNTTISFRKLSNKYNLDLSMIYYLNRGDYHFQENEQYPLRQVKDFSKKYHYCIDCGKEIYRGSKRCPECAYKASRIVKRPKAEELKELLINNNGNFTAVGKLYDVTDNTIRKWCKNYNLPFHSYDYKSAPTIKEKKEQKKKVAQIDTQTDEIIAIYTSTNEAGRALGKKKGSHIGEVCNGIHQTAYGYKWKFI